MRGKHILVRTIEIQKENWGSHAFFRDNYVTRNAGLTPIFFSNSNSPAEMDRMYTQKKKEALSFRQKLWQYRWRANTLDANSPLLFVE